MSDLEVKTENIEPVSSNKVSHTKKEKDSSGKEPFLRIAKRDASSFIYSLFIRIIAVAVSFLLIMWFSSSVSSMSIKTVWGYMVEGAFGNKALSYDAFVFNTNETFKNVMILLCIALALAPAYKMKFWNIGAQGQVLMGAAISGVIAWYCSGKMGNGSILWVMAILAVLVGGIWALIPAFFKVKLNANETLFTLMLNYIAIQITASLVDKWRGRQSALGLFNGGFLPKMFNSPYGFMYLVVPLIAVLLYFYMKHTKHGYEISIVGESLNTAKYAGISTKKVIMRTLFLSGAICGLVGFMCVGNTHSLSTSMGGSYGFTAIIVAWAAHFNPLAMALVSFAIVFFERGSGGLINACSNLNSYVSYIIVAIFLLILIGSEFFINYKLIPHSKILAFFNRIKTAITKFFTNIATGFSKKCPKASSIIVCCCKKIKGFFSCIAKFINKCYLKVTALLSHINKSIADGIWKFFKKISKAIKGLFVKKPKTVTSSINIITNENEKGGGQDE